MQNQNPLITVIVPIFNRFEVAIRAIESVVHQTYREWEIIIIDDNSELPFILPTIADPLSDRITLLRNHENLGPGLSRQRALDTAKGQYVCFLDSDDYYHPEFLSKSIKIHLLDTSIAATYTTAVYIQTGQIREGSDHSYHDIMPTLFEQRRPWPTCALLWKKASIASWRPLRTNQDSLFELECSLINNRILHVPEVLCFIDKGTGQNTNDLVSHSASDKHRNIVALHALKNRHKIQVAQTEQKRLTRAIRDRVVYVSSKLAGHGFGLHVINNGIRLLPLDWKAGFLILILGIPTTIPIKPIHKLIKNVISKAIK